MFSLLHLNFILTTKTDLTNLVHRKQNTCRIEIQPTRNAIIILLEACKRLTAYLHQAPAVAESLKQVRLIIKPINIVCGLLGAWLSLCGRFESSEVV
jgi:hypothetical protein